MPGDEGNKSKKYTSNKFGSKSPKGYHLGRPIQCQGHLPALLDLPISRPKKGSTDKNTNRS